MTVWKYPIEVDDEFTLELPLGAVLLDVQMQHGKPCLWALIDPKSPSKLMEVRKFRLAGTGHPIDERIKSHVGSFQMEGGALVFYLFELE